MGKKYTKLYSNYILSKKHQHTTKGTIWERDWVTIGNDHQIEPGKSSYYYDGNFLFTSNNFIQTKKRRKTSDDHGKWSYDDVADSKPIVNEVKVNRNSRDVRDFAYYGSASELFRTSVENIVKWFPGRITTSISELIDYSHYVNDEDPDDVITSDEYYAIAPSDEEPFAYVDDVTGEVYNQEEIDEWEERKELKSHYNNKKIGGYIIDNPYEIDLYHIITDFSDLNPMRYLEHSYNNYVCSIDGGNEYSPIVSYGVVWNLDAIFPIITENEYNELTYEKKIKYEKVYLHIVNNNPITPEEYDNLDEEEKLNYEMWYWVKRWIIPSYSDIKCIDNYTKLFDINLTREDGVVAKILAIWLNKSIIFVTAEDVNMIISPKQSVIDEFFNSLDGFEKQLLTRNSDPLYSNSFLTPFDTDRGYVYKYRTYTWPSIDGYISVSGMSFDNYVDSMQNLTEQMDELWTDNIWRCMTHESIKNYDRTYTRTFEEGDEEEFITGGNRIEKIVRIYGRVFDDIKRDIEGIKMTPVITYDGFNNMPDAEISDKNNYKGWEIYTTIPLLVTEESDEIINNRISFLSKYGYKWFFSVNTNEKDFEENDIDFNRALALSSKYLSRSKGTKSSIEMIMAMFGFGDGDFTLIENYRYIEPKIWDEDLETKFMTINSVENPEAMNGDIYAEIPAEEINLYGSRYIVPYFDDKKHYKGNIAFQSDGGWGLVEADGTYNETVPYMRSVQNIEELLTVNPYTVSSFDIFYVENLSTVSKYVEDTSDISNFFYIVNTDNPEEFSSWKNISINEKLYIGTFFFTYDDEGTVDGLITEAEYREETGIEDDSIYYDPHVTYKLTKEEYDFLVNEYNEGKYTEGYDPITNDPRNYTETENDRYDDGMYKKAMYLDSIKSEERGNNPHTGYGKYDMGTKFDEYMENPFKYMLENTVITDDSIYKQAYDDDVNFSLNSLECYTNNGKVKNLVKNENNTVYGSNGFLQFDEMTPDVDICDYYGNPHDTVISPNEYESLTEEEQSCYEEVYVEISTGEFVDAETYDAWYDWWELNCQNSGDEEDCEVKYEIEYAPMASITADMFNELPEESELRKVYGRGYFYIKDNTVIDYIKYNEIRALTTNPDEKPDEGWVPEGWEEYSFVYDKKIYDSEVYYKKGEYNVSFTFVDGVTVISYYEYLSLSESDKLLYTREHITKEQYEQLDYVQKTDYYSWRDFMTEFDRQSTKSLNKYIDEDDEIVYLENKLKELQYKEYKDDGGERFYVYDIDEIKRIIVELKYNKYSTYEAPSDVPRYYLNSKTLTFVNNMTSTKAEYTRIYYINYNKEETDPDYRITYQEWIDAEEVKPENPDPNTRYREDYVRVKDDKDVITQEEYDRLSYFEKLNYEVGYREVCSKYFKQYFFDIIYPYITQVIPSTTILRFEGFDT